MRAASPRKRARYDREAIDELCCWARNRIAHCQQQEAQFDVAIEAAVERRALSAVLRLLGEEVP